MSRIHTTPRAFVDTLEHTCTLYKHCQTGNKEIVIRDWLDRCLHNEKIPLPSYAVTEYGYVLHFLYEYRGSSETFNAYRREILLEMVQTVLMLELVCSRKISTGP